MIPGMPDFELLAKAFGVKGIVVSDPGQLSSAIEQMLAHNGPVLLNVMVKRDENCYPMVPPGKNNAQMAGLSKRPPSEVFPDSGICPECGHHNLQKSNFCGDCGTKL